MPASKLDTCKHLAQQVQFAHETSCLFRLTGAQKISANVACVLAVLGYVATLLFVHINRLSRFVALRYDNSATNSYEKGN